MPGKVSYRAILALAAGTAGLAGVGYLVYRFFLGRPDNRDESGSGATQTSTQTSGVTKDVESVSDDNRASPTTESEYEVINAQNSETTLSEPLQPVEAEESEPMISKRANVAEKKVLVLGLDRAGKTCLLSAMANEEQPQLYEATQGFNVMCITANGMDLSIWEIGGECKYRNYWENFLQGTNLLMFVVDSTDNGRLSEVKEEINKVLAKEEMTHVPLVVVCTKQDRKTSNKLSIEDIQEQLELDSITDRQVIVKGVEVKCGGAASNKGLQDLQDLITELCASQEESQEVEI